MKFATHACILFAQDLPALAAFYEGTLGLTRTPNPHYPETEWLELQGGPAFRVCLHSAVQPADPNTGRCKMVFRVDDVGLARDYLLRTGVKMGKHHHWSDRDACDGSDPDGNPFQIIGPKTAAAQPG